MERVRSLCKEMGNKETCFLSPLNGFDMDAMYFEWIKQVYYIFKGREILSLTGDDLALLMAGVFNFLKKRTLC